MGTRKGMLLLLVLIIITAALHLSAHADGTPVITLGAWALNDGATARTKVQVK